LGGEGVHVVETAVVCRCRDIIHALHLVQRPRGEDEELPHLTQLVASFLGVPTIGHGLFLKVDKRQGVLHAILDE